MIELLDVDIDDLEFHPDFANLRGANEGLALGDLTELKSSISAEGIQQACKVCRQVDEAGVTHLYLAAGFRRRACTRILVDSGRDDLRLLPCIVEDGTTTDWLVWNVVCDRGRELISPFKLAMRLFDMNELGIAVNTIAARTGLHNRTVYKYVQAVRDSHNDVLVAASNDEISLKAVQNLCGLPAHMQPAVLRRALKSGRITKRQGKDPLIVIQQVIREALKAFKQERERPPLPPPVDPSKPPTPADPLNTLDSEKAPATTAATTPTKTTAPDNERTTAESGAVPPTPKRQAVLAAAGLTPAQIQTRVTKLLEDVTQYESSGADIVRLARSLQLDTRAMNPTGVALTSTIDGIGMAVRYVLGLTCPICGEPLVTRGKWKSLPIVHVCQEDPELDDGAE